MSTWVTQATAENGTTSIHSDESSELQPKVALLREQNTTLENLIKQLHTQLNTAAQKIEELNSALGAEKKSAQEKWHKRSKNIYLAVKELIQFHSTLRTEAKSQIQAIRNEINGYKVDFQRVKVPAQNKMDRATEIDKIEAFDYWIDGNTKTKDQITTKSCWTGSQRS